MKDKAYVVGVGMVPFQKPGKSESYDVMATAATRSALADAGLDYDKVQQAYVGYVYGDSTCGQRALYQVGMTGIPVLNVNNNCSTGSSALFLARQAVESGAVECALALGFEQMQPGAIVAMFHDRVSPFTSFDAETDVLVGNTEIPLALRYFGGAGKAHMEEFGTTLETFAKIRAKASRHASRNPVAVPAGGDAGRSDGGTGRLARRHDKADGLPTDLWRGCGNRVLQGLRRQARSGQLGPHCRSGHDDGRPGNLRRA